MPKLRYFYLSGEIKNKSNFMNSAGLFVLLVCTESQTENSYDLSEID